MAYKTTKIKSGMTLPKLAQQYGTTPAAILKANKIPKLSAGMVVKIPPPPKIGISNMPALLNAMGQAQRYTAGGGIPTQPGAYSTTPVAPQVRPMQPGMDLQNPYTPFFTQSQGSFMSGSGGVNYQQPVAGGGVFPHSQGPLVNSGQQTQVQPVGINAADRSTYMTVQNSVAQPATTGAIQQRPPSGVYDPNAADAQDWLNYWNKLPVGTPKSNVYIPTKSEVWLMKGQARRRRAEEAEQDRNNYSAQTYVPPKKQEQPTGNASNQNVTWRIG